jgi:hypothetical protein
MKLIKDPFTGNFEILDSQGNPRGVLLRFQRSWAVFMDGGREQMRKTHSQALDLVRKLLEERPEPLTVDPAVFTRSSVNQ